MYESHSTTALLYFNRNLLLKCPYEFGTYNEMHPAVCQRPLVTRRVKRAISYDREGPLLSVCCKRVARR